MSGGFEIRMMGAADLAAYKALRDLILAAHPEAFSSDAGVESRKPPETYLSRIESADGDGPFTLLAWQQGQLVGALTCEREPRVKVAHIGKVVGMMVHPSARAQGIGRALLDAGCERARQRGIERLTLQVTSGNQTAVRLYEGAGFVRYGRLLRALKLAGRYHDKDFMVLEL